MIISTAGWKGDAFVNGCSNLQRLPAVIHEGGSDSALVEMAVRNFGTVRLPLWLATSLVRVGNE